MRRRPAPAPALLAVAVTIAALGAAPSADGSAEPAAGLSWQVSKSPFALSFLDDGNALTAEAGGDIAGREGGWHTRSAGRTPARTRATTG